jgi:hypothetical protein
MLDLENFDDLGICSRFVARLPTTDVVFTEVGRYSPLTNKTAVRAAHAYLLYRAPEFLIEPLDNLRSANGGGIPEAVLRGHYGLVVGDRRGQAAVFRRVSPAPEFQTNPATFLENLATPSRIVRAFDGSDVPAGERLTRLAFLADGALDRQFSGSVSYDVVFARSDLPIYELDLEGAWSRTDVAMAIALDDTAGHAVVREERVLAADQSTHLTLSWPEGIRAAELVLKLENTKPGGTRVILHDLRVQGQSPELAAYVAKLRFPPAR